MTNTHGRSLPCVMTTRNAPRLLLLLSVLLPLAGCGDEYDNSRAKRLAEVLQDGTAEERQHATRELRNLGERGFAALRPLLDAPDARLRARAAFIWKHYASDAPRHVGLASSLMRDPNWVVRRSAATVLARAGRTSTAAIEGLLVSVMAESHVTVLEEVATGLGGADGAQRAPATAALLGLVEHGAPSLRARAAQALGHAGRGDPRVDDAITTCLDEDPSLLVRVRAAEAHWRLGGDPADTLAVLEAGLLSSQPGVPQAATDGLRAMGADAEPLIDTLVELLENPTLRVRAAETLGALGRVAHAALPRLLEASGDRSSWFGRTAEKAVRLIR